MRDIKSRRKSKWLILFCFFLVLFSLPANAAIIYNFKDANGLIPANLNINQIQYYYGGEASNAATPGRFINSNSLILLVKTDPQKLAKTLKEPLPSDQFTFGAWDDLGTTLLLRVWDNAAGTNLGKYTDLVAKSNSTGQTDELDYKIIYTKIKDAPTKPILTKIDETTSKPLPNGATTGSLLIYSQASPHSSGLAVEISACEWTVNGVIAAGQTSSTLALSTPQWDLSAGKVYKVKVKYKNLWGDWGPMSDEYTHTIAGTGGVASQSLLLTFKRDANSKVGINSFSMPVAPANYAKYFADPVNNPAEWNAKSANDLVDLGIIRTAYDLVKAINKQVKEIDKTSIENVVSTFGEWKNDSMSEGGVLILGNDPEVEPAKTELTNIKLKPGAGYQLYLTGVDEVKIRIKN